MQPVRPVCLFDRLLPPAPRNPLLVAENPVEFPPFLLLALHTEWEHYVGPVQDVAFSLPMTVQWSRVRKTAAERQLENGCAAPLAGHKPLR